MGEAIEFRPSGLVDRFEDIDDAKNAIDNELRAIFDEHTHLWWSLPNPRMGHMTPDSLWNIDPQAHPWARDFVFEKVMSITTFRPESEPKSDELRAALIAELGSRATGRYAVK